MSKINRSTLIFTNVNSKKNNKKVIGQSIKVN